MVWLQLFSFLFAKTYRILKIFNNKALKQQYHKASSVYKQTGILVALYASLLVVQQLTSPKTVQVQSLLLSLLFSYISDLINTALYLSLFLLHNQNTTRPHHSVFSSLLSLLFSYTASACILYTYHPTVDLISLVTRCIHSYCLFSSHIYIIFYSFIPMQSAYASLDLVNYQLVCKGIYRFSNLKVMLYICTPTRTPSTTIHSITTRPL